MEDVSAVGISAEDAKEVSKFSLRLSIRRVLLAGVILIFIPYILMVMMIIGFPVRGFFTPKRAKSLFIFSVVWLLSVILFVAGLYLYLTVSMQTIHSMDFQKSMENTSLYEQSQKGLESLPDTETMQFIDSHCDKLDGFYTNVVSNGNNLSEQALQGYYDEYNNYVSSLEKTVWQIDDYDYDAVKYSYDGEIFDKDTESTNRYLFAAWYVSTVDTTTDYTVETSETVDGFSVTIEEETKKWSDLRNTIIEREDKFEKDLAEAKKYFDDGAPSASAEAERQEWSDYVNNSYLPVERQVFIMFVITYPAFFMICLIGLFLNVKYASGGKKLRKKAFAVQKKLFITGGKEAGENFIAELKSLSKKRDAEGFFALIAEKDAYCESVLPTLPFVSEKSAKEGISEIVMQTIILDGAAAGKEMRAKLKTLWKERDHAAIADIKSEQAARYAEYVRQAMSEMQTENAAPCELEYEGKSKFDGLLLQKIGWDILCFIVKWITLTIAKPATECWKQRWYTKHTVIDGRRLSFDGNGVQLFGKRTLNLILTIITLGIYAIFSKFSMDKWIAKHTHVSGESGEIKGTFDGNQFVWLLLRFGCFLLRLCTLFIITPFTECWKQAWYVKHCVYDGRRLYFDGNGAQLIGKWMLWWLLSIVTIGIYSFFAKFNVKKWVTKHTHLRAGYFIKK